MSWPFDLLNRTAKFPAGSDEWNLLQALCRAAASSGAFAYELAYQPGGAPGRPGVFSDFGALAERARSIPGQKIITFDPSFLTPGVPMPIAPGFYDFRAPAGAGGGGADTVWRTDPSRFPAPFTIELADGVTIDGVSTFRDVRVVAQNTSAPVIVAGPGDTGWFLQGWGMVRNDGTKPFIDDAVVGHNTLVQVSNDAELATGANNAPFIRMSATPQSMTVLTQDEALVDANVLAGVAGNTYGARIGSASGQIVNPQIGLPGGVIAIAFGENDLYIQHNSPPNPLVWVTLPGTTFQAIERIAAALAVRTGAPIP